MFFFFKFCKCSLDALKIKQNKILNYCKFGNTRRRLLSWFSIFCHLSPPKRWSEPVPVAAVRYTDYRCLRRSTRICMLSHVNGRLRSVVRLPDHKPGSNRPTKRPAILTINDPGYSVPETFQNTRSLTKYPMSRVRHLCGRWYWLGIVHTAKHDKLSDTWHQIDVKTDSILQTMWSRRDTGSGVILC